MKRILAATITAATAALLVLCAGCSLTPTPRPDPTQFYVLTPPSQIGAHIPLPAKLGPLTIGLKTVQIPAYLDHVEIAVRTATNETIYQPYARWAEPLAPAIQRQIALQLLQSPRIGQLHTMPFPLEQKRDYDIALYVTRCEGQRDAGGQSTASFAAIIVISNAGTGDIVARQSFTAPPYPWNGHDNSMLVQALGESVTKLAAATLAALPEAPATEKAEN
ncbi:hypothetical protein Ga0100231_012730 [Opitutaceae bacterium TAV4]|nr:hypothetical protein Ga0100231_012730 [Opitutaceae bacterium TAV4]RRJ99304.1 hypothetical protein Ga0100230_014020 [Opitutaceae bacterium TAV3]